MPYDEKLAVRVRRVLSRQKALAEIKMFGGLCYTVRGNMCCGVLRNELVLRVDPEHAASFLGEPHARPMDFTGRPMKNFLYIGAEGVATAASLRKWIKRSLDFVSKLPPKA